MFPIVFQSAWACFRVQFQLHLRRYSVQITFEIFHVNDSFFVNGVPPEMCFLFPQINKIRQTLNMILQVGSVDKHIQSMIGYLICIGSNLQQRKGIEHQIILLLHQFLSHFESMCSSLYVFSRYLILLLSKEMRLTLIGDDA